MKLPALTIKAAQHAAGVPADGIVGPQTLAALREYDDEHDEFDCADRADRLVVSVAQHAAGLRGKDIDGLHGPRTEAAVHAYIGAHELDMNMAAAAPRPPKPSRLAVWAPHQGPGIFEKDGVDLRDPTPLLPAGGLDPIPGKRRIKDVYGDAQALGKDGMRKRLLRLDGLPGRFNTGEGVLHGLHPLMAPHLRLALTLCDHFGVVDEIHRIGTFNYRHMRHDPAMPLSFHAYGICVDLNPRENFGWVPRGPEKSILPFSDGWRKKYPRGLGEVVVRCFKKAGFAWGGDWPSFRDPMHFELVA